MYSQNIVIPMKEYSMRHNNDTLFTNTLYTCSKSKVESYDVENNAQENEDSKYKSRTFYKAKSNKMDIK